MVRMARDVPRKSSLNICLRGHDPECLYQADNFLAAEKAGIHETSEQMHCWRGGTMMSFENAPGEW